MKTEACERYLNDPEGNAAHLRECAQCAALFADQSLPLDGKRLVFDANALPLAPWEGASQKSWPLIVAGTLAVFSLAVVMFLIAGVASISGILNAIRSTLPSFTTLQLLLQYMSEGVQHAPAPVQIAIGVSFIIVNTLLIVLLRRSPRGMDV